MLYEFVITPDVFDIALENEEVRHNIRSMLEQLYHKGGLVANLHKGDWVKVIRSHLKNKTPRFEDDIRILLTRLENRNLLINHPSWSNGEPINDRDWLNVALEVYTVAQFYCLVLGNILFSNYSLPNPPAIECSNIINSQIWTDRHLHVFLRKDENEYEKYLANLLRYTKHLVLIDPYLDCRDANKFRVIELCSKILSSNHYLCPVTKHINIHIGILKKESFLDIQHKWEIKLQNLSNTYGHAFRVYVWNRDNVIGHDKLHDRYIITDYCIIESTNSLECNRYDNELRWSLIENDMRDILLDKVYPKKTRLKFYGQFDINKRK